MKSPSKEALAIAAVGFGVWLLDGFLRPLDWVLKRWPR